MKNRKLLISFAILTLMVASLACSLFGGKSSESVAPADQAAESAASEDPPGENQAAEAEAPESAVDASLGEEYRSEEGGYAFRPIPDYQLEEFFGLASMTAPDGDPDLGPMLMLIGGTNEETATEEDIFDEFMQDAEGEAIEILDRKEIKVDGKPGILADIGGDVDGLQVRGRIVVVAVTPTQQFTMFASAPKDRWDEVAGLFDAVLASVYFFEPQEIDFSEGLGIEEEGDESSAAPPADLPAFGDFPSTYTELPEGGFAYLLATTSGAMPVMVNQGSVQDQSTSAEYVIGLVSADQRNTLTLFIPLNVTPGVLVMTAYDESSPTKGPGAAVYMGLTLYTNTDGIIVIEEMQGDTISGTFAFMAKDESGEELSVSGFFNQLPLVAP